MQTEGIQRDKSLCSVLIWVSFWPRCILHDPRELLPLNAAVPGSVPGTSRNSSPPGSDGSEEAGTGLSCQRLPVSGNISSCLPCFSSLPKSPKDTIDDGEPLERQLERS